MDQWLGTSPMIGVLGILNYLNRFERVPRKDGFTYLRGISVVIVVQLFLNVYA